MSGQHTSRKPRSEDGLRGFFDHVRTEKIQRFYDEYYARAQKSEAHSEYCRLLYGRDTRMDEYPEGFGDYYRFLYVIESTLNPVNRIRRTPLSKTDCFLQITPSSAAEDTSRQEVRPGYASQDRARAQLE